MERTEWNDPFPKISNKVARSGGLGAAAATLKNSFCQEIRMLRLVALCVAAVGAEAGRSDEKLPQVTRPN